MALGVEAVKAGRSVYFATLAEIVDTPGKAERDGKRAQRIAFITRSALLIAGVAIVLATSVVLTVPNSGKNRQNFLSSLRENYNLLYYIVFFI